MDDDAQRPGSIVLVHQREESTSVLRRGESLSVATEDAQCEQDLWRREPDGCAVAANSNACELPSGRQVIQFASVSPPAGPTPAVGGNLPLAPRIFKRNDVNLIPAGFVRLMGDRAAVR